MLNKLYHDGITGDMWLLLRNIYDGLILKVKWGDQTTESIDIKQGIRQGAKLSTLLYKRYNNTILDSITKSTLGATIGNITVSAPACADDIALLGESKDIQAMLNLLEYNTKRDLVKLNPEKTEVINVSKALQTHPKKYVLGDQEINRVRNVPSGSTENLEYIRRPTLSIWAGNPSIYTIRHEEIRTASKGNLQTISMPSRANRSSSHLHTNRCRTNRDNAGQKCNDLIYHLSQA